MLNVLVAMYVVGFEFFSKLSEIEA